MKRSDLFREYARVLDMCEGTGVPPVECVKCEGKTRSDVDAGTEPAFDSSPNLYDFTIAIVEGKPVFKGDEIYLKNGKLFQWAYYTATHRLPVNDLTWTKPRTFTLNGEVLPCPNTEGVVGLSVHGTWHYFGCQEDRDKVRDAINKILLDAQNS